MNKRLQYLLGRLCREQELEGEGGGGSGGSGGSEEPFDYASLAATISEDLFGGSTEEPPSPEDEPGEPKDSEDPPKPPAESLPTDPAPADPPPVTAPKTWRPEAAAKFAALPPDVQTEILKREEDMFRGIEGYKADATLGQTLKTIVTPHLQLLQSQGLDPIQQLDGLMRAHVALSTAPQEQKLAFFNKLAQDYGVDMSALGAEAPYVDPQVLALQKQLGELQSRLSGREQQEAAAARERLEAELTAFAADPAHPHFDDVANDIAALLRSGAAPDLKTAYEKAVWMNPQTRAKEQARQATEAAAKAKEEAAARTAKARKATSANVQTRAKVGGGTAPRSSMDETLQATYAEIMSREN